MTACSGTDADGARADDAQANDIIGGKAATQYPEAVIINMLEGGQMVAGCSGALIAPKVVLTAGHCVHNWSDWQIVAPYAGTKAATSSATRGATYDWKVESESVDPSKHDIGLLFLDSAIELDAYPKIADKPLADGGKLKNVGRIQNGKLSNTGLFVSALLTTEPGADLGFPFDYGAKDVIESGDSGGPDVLSGAAPHTIVAVNSGSNAETEVLARVDLVASWIAEQVKAEGGSKAPKAPKAPNAPASPKSSACAHDPCATGAELEAKCDPCVTKVCKADAFCCGGEWDEQCASEWSDVCQEACTGEAP